MKNQNKLQAHPLSQNELDTFFKTQKHKIILLQDIDTLDISCSRCGAHANHSNEINHRDCCSYRGGSGC